MRQIILDTETTGFYYNGDDRLIEFAGVEMVGRQLTGRYLHIYVDPERDVPEEAVAVHGLTKQRLQELGAKTFSHVATEIADFLRGAELVIHNAPFDVGFLNMEFQRLNMPTIQEITSSVVDTLVMAKELYPGQKNSLDALCSRLEIDRSKRVLHGALIDCELLADVYLAMTRNQFTLDDMLNYTTSSTQDNHSTLQNTNLNPTIHCKVQCASAEELALHEQYLTDLDTAIKGNCLWHQQVSKQSE